ncbi:protein piccolo-like [Anoplopoma fimbria]|uniref:protein piccolo-like n=1 Tax=Anoplopoma fimbria TaxID=229290 RepID=UPI0023EC4B33|nr:protein piccolo-like [Anoplopoma fimbria]
MHNRMMRKGKKKSAAFYLAAAVLTCYLAQTIDCYRLRKTKTRGWQKEADAAKTIDVQDGEIVFGRGFEKGSVVDGTKKTSSNASVEDEAAYQADYAGWSKGQAQDASSKEASSKEAAWKHMSPTLQCGGDQLKFRVVGPGDSQFAVEQGNAPPMPLSQVPSTCGYGINRNSLWLIMSVPYNGCNIVQEGGSYVLPMRWQGIPVSLSCPKPAAPAPQNQQPQKPWYLPSIPHMPEGHKNPDNSRYFSHYMQFPKYPTVPDHYHQHPFMAPHPLPKPETTTPTKLEPQKFPYMDHYHQHPFMAPHPLPKPETTTPTKPEPQQFPHMDHYHQHPSPFPKPETTTPTGSLSSASIYGSPSTPKTRNDNTN